jgi:hypothetical protein
MQQHPTIVEQSHIPVDDSPPETMDVDQEAQMEEAVPLDPRYAKYLKLMKLGVNINQFRAQLLADGLNEETLLSSL